jgi:sugar lactone lactonase YvrE
VDLERPIRADEPAFDGFALDTDHLAWSTTSDDGKPVVRVLAWNDEGVGVVELPSEDGGTIVR